MNICPFTGKVTNNSSDIEKLISNFERIIDLENAFLQLKSDYRNIIYFEKFDIASFSYTDIKKFQIVLNENFITLEKTFENHDLFTARKAEEKFNEYKKAEEDLPIKNELLPPQEFIEKYYNLLNTIFVAFNRNKTFRECFNIDGYEEILNEPRDLLEFLSTFELFNDDTITISPTTDFINKALIYFKVPKDKIKGFFVFDVNNKLIFPLFIRFRNKELGDIIIISKDFSRFVYTVLHVILTKDLFDKKTVKVSKKFENAKVKSEFQENGYFYINDITDRKKATLQIDGLAIKDEICFVIECKGWRFPKLIDEVETKQNIIRDLEGVVLGKEYTTKSGGQFIKNKPSILMKVDFVRENIESLGNQYKFDHSKITIVEGLIITIDFPPIDEFKGIKVLSINQISNL